MRHVGCLQVLNQVRSTKRKITVHLSHGKMFWDGMKKY